MPPLIHGDDDMQTNSTKRVWIFFGILFAIYFCTAFYYNYKAEMNPVSADLSETERAMCSLTRSDGMVTLTLPPTYVGEVTQEQLNEVAEKKGYASITLNKGGSATYVMSEDAHKEMLLSLKEGIDQKIKNLPFSESSYKSIESISYNDDYTDFEIRLNTDKMNDKLSMASVNLKLLSNMYNAFNGIGDAGFSATYYGKSGSILATTNK